MNNLKLQYYCYVFMQMKRGNSRGRIINAKPIFLLSLFDLIEKKEIIDNKVFYAEQVEGCYKHCYNTYEPAMEVTPLYKPFYHLISDGFWHIEWKVQSEIKISAKYLKENVKYARFDNALWDLLQDSESRQALREVIIKHFLT